MDNEIKRIMERTEEALSFPNASAIVLTKHGADDWEVYFPDIDYSVRGMKKDIMEEISTYCV